MSYTHLTIAERAKIEGYLEIGYSVRKIARLINRSPSTVSREIRRHPAASAEEAHRRYVENKSRCGAKTKSTPQLRETIQKKLHETWSPEQIVNRLFQGRLSFKTIYRWIY